MRLSIGQTNIQSIGHTCSGWRQTADVIKTPDELDTVWLRVRTALREKGMSGTQAEAAKIAGVRQPSVSEWNQPGHYPTIESAVRLAERLGVCVEWIMTGRGPKRPGTALDHYADRLMQLWAELTLEARQQIVGYAEVVRRGEPGEDSVAAPKKA